MRFVGWVDEWDIKSVFNLVCPVMLKTIIIGLETSIKKWSYQFSSGFKMLDNVPLNTVSLLFELNRKNSISGLLMMPTV